MLIHAYIGFDLRMPDAYMVAARSMIDRCSTPIVVKPLLLPHLRAARAYTRKTLIEDGLMVDELSQAPMATEFAISRFLIPALECYRGFTIFCDNDFMFRDDVETLMMRIDKNKAVSCVKHNYKPDVSHKMDGQIQTSYPRKNWSSLMVFNNEHPANKWLTVSNVNNTTGRDLHRFCWLSDDDIGEIDHTWNWLEGHSSMDISPKAVHYTRGTPDMAGYEDTAYADEWRRILGRI